MAESVSLRRDRIIAAMVTATSVARAAGTAGVSERTVYRVLGEAGARDEVARLRREAFASGFAALKACVTDAVEVQLRLLKSKSEDIRYRASRSVLEMSIRHEQLLTLAGRIEEQEGRLVAIEREVRAT